MAVLIVDDSHTTRALVSALVEDMGYQAIAVESGVKALEVFPLHEVDLVLLDVIMPEIDGFQTAQQIRSISEKDWIPIIFLSGQNDVDDIVKGIDAGGDAYLGKPINGPVVQAMIRAMMRISDTQKALSAANRKLHNLARMDGLTRLPNRRAFDEHFSREWLASRRKQTHLGLLVIDVDNFKLYNDEFGHDQGDVCLKQVATALRIATKRPVDLVARFGGEEFVALLPETGEEGAKYVANRLRKAVAGMKLNHSHKSPLPHVTVSIGIACMVADEHFTKNQFFKMADEALYAAKNQGRNCVSVFKESGSA